VRDSHASRLGPVAPDWANTRWSIGNRSAQIDGRRRSGSTHRRSCYLRRSIGRARVSDIAAQVYVARARLSHARSQMVLRWQHDGVTANTFRRASRLAWTPAVAVAVAGVVYLAPDRRVAVVLVVLSMIWWVPFAIVDAFWVVVITDDELRMRGLLSRTVVVSRIDVGAAHYRRYSLNGPRGRPELFFIEIRNPSGYELHIWRYGWGRRRHELFGRLQAWLDNSSYTIDARTRAFLVAASR
jgi:hypothetical protein